MPQYKDVIAQFSDGKISLAECWNMLASVRPSRRSEFVLTQPPSKVYEKLNERELEAIRLLHSVHFGQAVGARRFFQQIKDATELTARQREYLRNLVYKYRRQIWKKNPDWKANEFCKQMEKRNE